MARSKEKTVSGIYKIQNTVNFKCYIGSSHNIPVRWKRHKSDLSKGNHHSPYLQKSWDKYGSENFIFEIIELCDEDLLLHIEQRYIDSFKPEYNCAPIAGSNLGVEYAKIRKLKGKSPYVSSSKGKKLGPRSDETKRKISEATKGKPKPISPENRVKMIEGIRKAYQRKKDAGISLKRPNNPPPSDYCKQRAKEAAEERRIKGIKIKRNVDYSSYIYSEENKQRLRDIVRTKIKGTKRSKDFVDKLTKSTRLRYSKLRDQMLAEGITDMTLREYETLLKLRSCKSEEERQEIYAKISKTKEKLKSRPPKRNRKVTEEQKKKMSEVKLGIREPQKRRRKKVDYDVFKKYGY